jgi:long-chain acyl-CoA synthetase
VEQARRLGAQGRAARERVRHLAVLTWADYLRHVREFSLGLVDLGLRPGDKVAIVGDNRPEWVFAELAALCAGAVPLGIYQDSTATEVGYVIDHAVAVVVVAEDQEQVDKILELQEDPKVRR